MPVLKSAVDTQSEVFRTNRADMLTAIEYLDSQLALAAMGGGEKSLARHKARGKLTVRERVALLIDPDSPFLEISALAGHQTDYPVGGGPILGIATPKGVEFVIPRTDPPARRAVAASGACASRSGDGPSERPAPRPGSAAHPCQRPRGGAGRGQGVRRGQSGFSGQH